MTNSKCSAVNTLYFVKTFKSVCLARKVFVKSTKSAITLFLPSAQYEVNSKLWLVFLLCFYCPYPFPFDMAQPGCIRIIFRMRPVENDKDLDIFIKSACRPETVALVALDLIECLTNRNAAPFEFNMHQR